VVRETIIFTFHATQDGEPHTLVANLSIPEKLARELTASAPKKADRESSILAQVARDAFLNNHPFTGTGGLTITKTRLHHPSAEIMVGVGGPDVVLRDGIEIWYFRWVGRLLVRGSKSQRDADQAVKDEPALSREQLTSFEEGIEIGYDE